MAVRRRSLAGAAGQHFLRSSRLATELVADAEVAGGDLIVEVGGGTGVLTAALARARAAVIVIERDWTLAAHLRARFDGHRSITVIEDDVARFGWPTEPFAVVANLPFEGSGAVLGRLLRDPHIPLRSADVIVQWEFAAKHASVWPATQRAIYWRAWHELSIGRRLSRTAFAPPPGVDTGVLRLRRLTRPRVAAALHEEYWAFLSAAFDAGGPIRRDLRPALSSLEIKRLAPVLGFSLEARPWEIDAAQWAQLFAFARARRP